MVVGARPQGPTAAGAQLQARQRVVVDLPEHHVLHPATGPQQRGHGPAGQGAQRLEQLVGMGLGAFGIAHQVAELPQRPLELRCPLRGLQALPGHAQLPSRPGQAHQRADGDPGQELDEGTGDDHGARQFRALPRRR